MKTKGLYLARAAVGCAPSRHDECIVDGQTRDDFRTGLGQFVVVADVSWQMALQATGELSFAQNRQLQANTWTLTDEQTGVKAPGTPNRIPFLPLNRSVILTSVPGVPSLTTIGGRELPACSTRCTDRSSLFFASSRVFSETVCVAAATTITGAATDVDLDFQGPQKAKWTRDVFTSTYLGHLCNLQGSNCMYLGVQAQTRHTFPGFPVSK